MNVVARLEISDTQRNYLARMMRPTAPRRKATRTEVREFVAGCIAALGEPDLVETSVSTPASSGSRMNDLMHRLRQEDPEFCAGRSDGFVCGAAKVAYAQELRGTA